MLNPNQAVAGPCCAVGGHHWRRPANQRCENAANHPCLPALLFVLLQYELYQPIPFDEPVITLQDGLFCPTSQPKWSAYRDPSFGHGKSTALAA